jgi:hypothetical protein
MDLLHAAISIILFLYLLTTVGNHACRQMFILTRLKSDPSQDASEELRAGRVIGALERLVLSLGILTHSWEVLAAVVALKTVARFKELDDRKFAEYFLAGSLFSVLWAVAVTSLWVAYDRHAELGVFTFVATFTLQPASP